MVAHGVTLLRHAAPEVQPDVSPASWRLSRQGRSAAQRLRGRLASGAVLASSLEVKALQTLCLASGITADGLHLDHRFGEVRRVEPLDDDHRARRLAWVSGDIDERHSGWETSAEAADRFQAGLNAFDGDVVVATHGMVMTAWLVALGVVECGDAAGIYWTRLGFPEVVHVMSGGRGR